MLHSSLYTPSLTEYKRRQSIEVHIGEVPLGGANPIRVQSMTTIDTMDTIGSVEQAIRMIEAGCEYVRITAPSVKEAANLENIRKELRNRGYNTPLIADIHFTPNAAELAARLVEKVRINPGNYADKKRFEVIDYTDESYQAELNRIRERFVPLVKICKEYGTAMRIGTNHGSLSDRILSRYGDTPLGMVESALEFLRIAEDENYFNIVLSMKSSNTQVMVQAYRMLALKLQEEGLKAYPFHLGVTEAGEGEDGRIKSAVGIGTLLEDGLGDTVRVSLTEDPELEVPVAKALVNRYNNRVATPAITPIEVNSYPIQPFQYHKRKSTEVFNIGTGNVPRIIADVSHYQITQEADMKPIGHHYLPATDKWVLSDTGADFVFGGDNLLPYDMPNGTRVLYNYSTWKQANRAHAFPVFSLAEYTAYKANETKPLAEVNFIQISDVELMENLSAIKQISNNDGRLVLLLSSENTHKMPALRRAFVALLETGIEVPVIVHLSYANLDESTLSLYAATDMGGLLIDGLGDGLMLTVDGNKSSAFLALANSVAFTILQAARTRMSKTEYISCPSCGRTLFDLQETTAKIRKVTDHLKGVKIGIMGCIVNGPGEMADADYGYVGIGKGKIALYKGQEVVQKTVPEAQAVEALIKLIKDDGKWVEPEVVAELQ